MAGSTGLEPATSGVTGPEIILDCRGSIGTLPYYPRIRPSHQAAR